MSFSLDIGGPMERDRFIAVQIAEESTRESPRKQLSSYQAI
jgi:hypothetical protein